MSYFHTLFQVCLVYHSIPFSAPGNEMSSFSMLSNLSLSTDFCCEEPEILSDFWNLGAFFPLVGVFAFCEPLPAGVSFITLRGGLFLHIRYVSTFRVGIHVYVCRIRRRHDNLSRTLRKCSENAVRQSNMSKLRTL